MSLRLAFLLSLLLHAAMIAWPGTTARSPALARDEPQPLLATLMPPETPAEQPPLILPEPPAEPTPPRKAVQKARPEPSRETVPRRPPPPRPSNSDAMVARIGPLSGEAARSANEQLARELFYPEEAVRRGLEGEVLVQLFLDETGDVIAARLERGSGHDLLDQAALRAARAVRSLPASAPREALLPVRFRLR